jgi:Ca-activated chloride channel family protein
MFDLANPSLLLLLPLPLVVIKYVKKYNSTEHLFGLKLPFIKQLEAAINANQVIVSHSWAKLLLSFLWVMIIMSLSGPRWIGSPVTQKTLSHQLMLVLDLSPSMGIVDRSIGNRPVNRLTLVKQTALDFLEQRTQDRIGLILFGSKAFVQTPLTYDHRHVIERLQQASVGLLGQSTAIGDALGLAIKHMAGKKGDKIVVLLTDGANNAGIMQPNKAAELCRDQDIKLYIIGLDQAPQSSGFGSFFAMNMNLNSDLDEDTLKNMANTAQGKYFRSTDRASLTKAYQEIDKLSATINDAPSLRPQIFYYHWLLVISIIMYCGVLGWRLLAVRGADL